MGGRVKTGEFLKTKVGRVDSDIKRYLHTESTRQSLGKMPD